VRPGHVLSVRTFPYLLVRIDAVQSLEFKTVTILVVAVF